MKIKTSVTLSEKLLAAIDEVAGPGCNRSAVLEQAATEWVRRKRREEADRRDAEIYARMAATQKSRRKSKRTSRCRFSGGNSVMLSSSSQKWKHVQPGKSGIGPLRRGELYRISNPPRDVRNSRIYLVVSRDEFLSVLFSSAGCVPVYTTIAGIETEVILDEANGLKNRSVARCDEATSVPRALLTDYLGTISREQNVELSRALARALQISSDHFPDY